MNALLRAAVTRFEERGRRLPLRQVQVGDYGHRLDLLLPNGMACSYHSEQSLPFGGWERNDLSVEEFCDQVIDAFPEGFMQ